MIESNVQSIEEWVQIFNNTSSSNDELRNKTNEFIISQINENSPNLIVICSQILTIEDNIDKKIILAKMMSSILLTKILNYENQIELDFKRKNLTSELIELIKNALKLNIFSDNPTIRNKCAQCYSILFSILTINWPNGIELIVNFFNNIDLLPVGFMGLISIMHEIVNRKNFVCEIVSNFETFFVQTFVFCIDILSKNINEMAYIPELRIEACKYIIDLILHYPQIMNDGENFGAKIPILLENLPNSFQIDNIDLFNNLHELLFVLVKEFYPQTPFFMEKIASFVGNGFSMNSSYSNICIFFWNNVANFEEKLVERYTNSIKLKQPYNDFVPLNPLLSETAIYLLLPVLVNFIEMIDETKTSVDDALSNPEPYMYSTMTIASFYRIVPHIVFDYLKDKIIENFSKNSWTSLHSGVQMIYAIVGEPLDKNVGMFIGQQFETLLLAAKGDQVPRLRETSLFVISLIIKNYPKIITQAGEFTDKRINDIIEIIEPSMQLNEQERCNISNNNRLIFIRYANIISQLSSAWKMNLYQSRIGNFFDKFYEMFGQLFNCGIKNSDHMLIQESGSALDSLILNSTPNILNKIDWLYSKTLEMLNKTKSFYCSQEIIFTIQSSLCSNIKSILVKLKKNPENGKEIISKYAAQTLSILYDLLSNRNALIYEEGLMAISALICATNIKNDYIELFSPDTFDRLMNEFIPQALISENEGVTNSACILIGNMFCYLSSRIPILNTYIPVIFNTLSDLIMNHKDIRSIHPFVLKAIASLFNYSQAKDDSVIQLEVPFYELLVKIYNVSLELDMTNINDVEYGNLLYQYLTEAFGGYAKVFYNSDNSEIEKNQLFLLDDLAKFIYRLRPKIRNEVYLSFKQTAMQFAQNCSRKNNSILNRCSIHRILKLAIENFTQENLRNEFQQALLYLKSR